MVQLLSVAVLFVLAISELWVKPFWSTLATAAAMLFIARAVVPFQTMGIVWVWYLCVAIFGTAMLYKPRFQTWRLLRKTPQAPAS